MLKRFKNSRGDTLVEVMFAIAVFSFVAVGSLSIMNQGTATAQRALEITLVRQEIDAQAETLRFLNSSYIAARQSGVAIDEGSPAGQWQKIQAKKVSTESSFDSSSSCPQTSALGNSFILNTHSATFGTTTYIKQAVTFSQVTYSDDNVLSEAQGIWIEAISPAAVSGIASYIDFHIQSCWDSPGQSIPVTLGTIVRLYEP